MRTVVVQRTSSRARRVSSSLRFGTPAAKSSLLIAERLAPHVEAREHEPACRTGGSPTSAARGSSSSRCSPTSGCCRSPGTAAGSRSAAPSTPGIALGARVGSWFCGRNVAPNGTALICTCRSRSVRLRADVGDVETMTASSSLCWMPTFHWLTRGGLKSYAVGFSDSVGYGSLAAGGQVLQPAPLDRGVQHARRVGDHVEHHVALRPVVEDPEAAAEDRRALAGQVVDDADARRHPEGVAVLQLVVDALAGLEARR